MRNLRKHLKNTDGSVLSTSLIVVALLSFSLSIVTSDTVNLSKQTTIKEEQVVDTSISKSILDMVLEETKLYIEASIELDPVEDFFNNKADELENNYGVTIVNNTINEELDEKVAAAIKISMPMENGVLSRTTYYTYDGAGDSTNPGDELASILNDPDEFEKDDPYEINFYFSLVTAGDLILNGGAYDIPSLYANNIYLNHQSPYLLNRDPYNQHLTPSTSSHYPIFNPEDDTKIFYNEDYKYCERTCISINDDGQAFTIHKDQYQNVIGSNLANQGQNQEVKLSSFFQAFDYNSFFLDFLYFQAATGSANLKTYPTMETFKDIILQEAKDIEYRLNKKGKIQDVTLPNSQFADITDDTLFTSLKHSQKMSLVHRGDLFLEDQLDIGNENTLIVFGDLILDSIPSKNHKDYAITGSIIVTGDVIFQGESMNFSQTIFALGQVIFDFKQGHGLDNTKNGNGNDNTPNFNGLTILAKDNIKILSMYDNNRASFQGDKNFYAFLYTEESIYIDGLNSRMVLEGSFYAKASGESKDPIFYKDQNGQPINGIIINAYHGYLNPSDELRPGLDNSTFSIQMIEMKNDDMQLKFDSLPLFIVTVMSDDYFVDDGYEVE